MGATLIALAPFMLPEAAKFLMAWLALRKTGVADQDIVKLIEALAASNDAKLDHAIELLAGIPEPK